MTPDPKAPARIKDSKAGSRKLHRDRRCRMSGCDELATQAHHIVFRSMGGDDVEDNMLPLCTDCHVLVHSKGPCAIQLRAEEIRYVRQKFVQMGRGKQAGDAYIERRYT